MIIYALKRNGIIFYVGKTLDMGARLWSHRRVFGKDLDFEVLETCSGKRSSEREAVWIQRKFQEGCPLLNKNSLEGPIKQPRAKIPKRIEDKDLPKAYVAKKNRLKSVA